MKYLTRADTDIIEMLSSKLRCWMEDDIFIKYFESFKMLMFRVRHISSDVKLVNTNLQQTLLNNHSF